MSPHQFNKKIIAIQKNCINYFQFLDTINKANFTALYNVEKQKMTINCIALTHCSCFTALSVNKKFITANHICSRMISYMYHEIYYNLTFTFVQGKHSHIKQTEIKSLPDTRESCIIRIYHTVKKQNSQVKMYIDLLIESNSRTQGLQPSLHVAGF